MVDGDYRLDEFFQRYRAACPDVEPTPNFMPILWERIEGRRGFAFTFERMARPAMTIFAALCLLLLVLNVAGAGQGSVAPPTYTDALAADSTAEKTDYTEAIWNNPTSFQAPQELRAQHR
ncbi:MAG TPA: hypothetical protein VLJ11_11715 [Bryobacteraceae bacterium]|nr:hypothetical protein [Bryobacteraceae bacterium]